MHPEMQRHHTRCAKGGALPLGVSSLRRFTFPRGHSLLSKEVRETLPMEASLQSPPGLMDGVGNAFKSILSLLKTGSDHCS